MSFTALQSASGTVGTTSTTVTFGDNTANIPVRYDYFLIQNTGATNILYVRTDGTAATTSPGDMTIAVQPGQSVVVANALPLWTQSANVIPKGTLSGSAAGTGTPYEIGTPYGSSLYGQKTSPGSSVSLVGSAASTSYTVSGTG